jgi:hypothetical protein
MSDPDATTASLTPTPRFAGELDAKPLDRARLDLI